MGLLLFFKIVIKLGNVIEIVCGRYRIAFSYCARPNRLSLGAG
jgi:hypothetical protein